MKTNDYTTGKGKRKWTRRMLLLLAAVLFFNFLYAHGISPVWAAVVIVFCKGLFRFIYGIACLLVSLAILAAILGYLVF